MSVINWTVFQKHIQNWVVSSAGLAADAVRWGGQKFSRPSAYPYMSLAISGVEQKHLMVKRTYVSSLTPGADRIDNQYGGSAKVTVTLQAFSLDDMPATTGRRYLDDALAYLWEDVTRESFSRANIAHIRTNGYVNLSGEIEGTWISRWAVDVEFYVAMALTKTTPDFIDSLVVTGTISGVASELEPEWTIELE